MWAIAYTFHFSPESLWDMTIEDMMFWTEGIKKVKEWQDNSL